MEKENRPNEQEALGIASRDALIDDVIALASDDEEIPNITSKWATTATTAAATATIPHSSNINTEELETATKKRKSTTTTTGKKKQPKLADELLAKPTLDDALALLRQSSASDVLLVAEELLARLKKEPEDVQKELTVFRAALRKSLNAALKWKPSCKHGLASFAASAHCSKELYESIMAISEEEKSNKQKQTFATEMHCDEFWRKVGFQVVPKSMWGSFPVQGNVKVTYHLGKAEFKVTGGFGC